jgi:hypothetical protein
MITKFVWWLAEKNGTPTYDWVEDVRGTIWIGIFLGSLLLAWRYL